MNSRFTQPKQPRSTWKTWSKTVRCTPAELAAPTSEDAIVDLVRSARQAGLTVRAAGSGHSFNPLASTDGVLLDLSGYRGIVDIDPAAGSVTVKPGTTLWQLSSVLHREGLALANLGSLADQTVAGAVSTGNHGTGIGHPPLAGEITALRLVTADGRARALDARSDPAAFHCARTSLGVLGIISEITLRCVPRFNLRAEAHGEPLEQLLERFEAWAASAEHVALSWLPWSDRVSLRSLHVTDDAPTRGAGRRRYATTLQEVRCGLIGQAGRWRPAAVHGLTDRMSGRGGSTAAYVDASHRVFTFPQPVRFLAMEHALALERVAPAMTELRAALRRSGQHSPYSILVRVGAADDAPLSPAYGRATGYVNLTVPRTAGYMELLRTVEHVLREHGGRPHWAKAHTATAEVLAPRYPAWGAFQRVRANLDPTGLFANDYVERVLGPSDARAAMRDDGRGTTALEEAA
jgi:L-gulonolactone oxidase